MKWTVTLSTLLLTATTAAAKVTSYPVPTAGSQPFAITTAFDASWFTEVGASKVGRIDSAGVVTEIALPAGAKPLGITPTSAGTLAVAANGTASIDEVSPSGTVTVHPVPPGLTPYDVVLGSDSGIWFTAQPPPGGKTGRIGVLSYDGKLKTYDSGGGVPWGITRGNDGNLWFAVRTPTGGAIGRITTTGEVTTFPTGDGSLPAYVAPGGDGNIWYTDQASGSVGRVTPAGKITKFAIGASKTVFGITKNADDAVVVADTGGHAIYTVGKTGRVRRIAVDGAPVRLDIRYPTGMWFTLQDGRIGLLSEDELEPACRVPKLVGKTLARAKKLLATADCKLGRVSRRKHRGVKGRVLAQSEKPGKRFAPGFAIDVTVSR